MDGIPVSSSLNQPSVTKSGDHQTVPRKGPQIQHDLTNEQIRAELQRVNGDGKIYQFDGNCAPMKNLNCHSLDRSLLRPTTEYRYSNSLIAVWVSETTIVRNESGIPDHKVWYYVFFTFVTNKAGSQIHLQSKFNDFYDLTLDKTVAWTQPLEMSLMECNGGHCHMTFDKNSAHCKSCRDLEPRDLFYMIAKKLTFARFQNANIIAYIKMCENIDLSDEKVVDEQLALVLQDQKTMADISADFSPGGRYDQELEAFKARLEKQKIAAQQTYTALNNKYGGNIYGVRRQIAAKKQEFVDARDAVKREEQQRKEQAEAQAKRRQLDELLSQQQKLAQEIAAVQDSLPNCADGNGQ